MKDSEISLWVSDVSRLQRNINDFMRNEPHREPSLNQNLATILLADAYAIRLQWGDIHFPVRTMQWVETMEDKLGIERTPLMKPGCNVAEFKFNLFKTAERRSKEK